MKKLLLAAGIFASLQMSSQIWTEDFNDETGLPTGWTQETLASDGGWSVNTATGLSSTSFAIAAADGKILGTNDDLCDCDKSNDFVKLPAFDLTLVTTPYLQFDIYYYAATYNGVTEELTVEASTDGGSSWTVLETVAGAAAWHPVALNLSAYAGGNVTIGIRYNDGGDWLYGVGLDNFSLFEPDLSVIDATITESGIGVLVEEVPGTYYGFTKYINGMEVIPAVVVANNAFTSITSFDISYTVNGNTITESVNGEDIGFGETMLYEFQSGATVEDGMNDFAFTISNVNGGAETVTNNNGGSGSIDGFTPVPGKVVVAEEGTGTWCGWCPRGTVFMDYLTNKYPETFVGIAVHNGDPMTVTDYDAAMANNISGYPSGLVDRADYAGFGEVDPQSFEMAMMDRLSQDPGVQIETATSLADGGIYVVSNLSFTETLSGSYKIAVVLIEDAVSGTGSTWNQTNYYSGGGNGPMGGFESLGGTVPANSIEYNHVARIIEGGWGGTTGSVPTNPAAGLEHSYTVFIELDSDWNLDNLHAVTLLIKSSGGEIINAGVSESAATAVAENTSSAATFNVYPNPAQENAFIRVNNTTPTDVTVTIIDGTGKVVASQVYNNLNTESVVPVNTANYANGIYTVSVQMNGEVLTRTLMINK
ncbi:MAG: choice-of-anchor J domain-containing protein [Flavobacteriales bacterium]